MRKVAIVRGPSRPGGTFGTLRTDSGYECSTGELPWKANAARLSCVPVGVYPVTWLQSIRWGFCYHVNHVFGRTNVEIHPANFMGDMEKGFKCQLEGCIALGVSVGRIAGQVALLESKIALSAFEADLKKEPFELTISWGN